MASLRDFLPHFQTTGCDLYTRGMITMPAGNLSMRRKDKLVVTKSGSRLGFLSESDLTETGIYSDDANTASASSELAVHRAIYKETGCQAIVHAHPPYAVALSYIHDHIEPTDIEGKLCLPCIPVIGSGIEPSPGNLAEEIASALKEHPIVLVYRHGSFACGTTLQEAYIHTEVLEYSCHILHLRRQMQH